MLDQDIRPESDQDLLDRDRLDPETAASDQAKLDQMAAGERDGLNSGNIADKEGSGTWEDKYKPNLGNHKKLIQGLWRQKGPAGGILGIIIIAMLGVSSLAPSILLVHVKEVFMGNFNHSEAASEEQGYQRLLHGLQFGATKGSCSVVKFACRYKLMPNDMLTSMKEGGFKPLDIDGKPIDIQDSIKGYKVASFDVTLDDGSRFQMTAKNARKTLKANPKLRASWHTSGFNPRYAGFWNAKYRNLLAKLGTTRKNILGGKTKSEMEATVKSITNRSADVSITSTEKAPSDGDSDSQKQATEDANKTNKDIATDAKNDLKSVSDTNGKAKPGELVKKLGGKTGGVAALVASFACGAGPAIKTMSSLVRQNQVQQLVQVAMLVLVTADVIKSGDASAEQVAFMGSMLTNTFAMSNNTKSRAGTDSALMKMGLFGDRPSANANPNPIRNGGWTNFVPGAGALGPLLEFNKQVESVPGIKETCDAINSDVGSASLDLAFGGVPGFVIGQVMKQAFILAGPLLEPLIFKFAAGIAGNITADIYGEDVGDAVAAGTLLMLSSASAVRSGSFVGKKRASAVVAYQQEYILAYAAEQRSTLSPFDIYSPYTAMGSIVSQYLPSLAKIGNSFSLSSLFNGVSGIFGNTLSSLNSNALASDSFTTKMIDLYTKEDVDSCQDPNLEGLATTPVCSSMSTIDPTYASTAIGTMLNSRYVAKSYNEDTGEATGEKLKEWEEKCVGESLEDLSSLCNSSITTDDVTPEDKAMMALYFENRTAREFEINGPSVGDAANVAQQEDTSISNTPGEDLPPAEGWSWPIQKGLKPGPCFGVSFAGVPAHAGMDINSDIANAPVYAMHEGTVIQVRNSASDAAGKFIRIAATDGRYYIYQHLSSILVKQGDKVKSNQLVAKAGKTGDVRASSAIHLHIVVSTKNDFPSRNNLGGGIDPMTVLPKPAPEGYKCTR